MNKKYFAIPALALLAAVLYLTPEKEAPLEQSESFGAGYGEKRLLTDKNPNELVKIANF